MDDRSIPEMEQALFESMPIPMWVYDVETWAFLDVNEAAIERYGYSREQFATMTIADIRPESEVDGLRLGLEIGRDVAVRRGTGLHRTCDGTVFQAEIVSQLVRRDDRLARVVVAQDVSERVDAARLAAALERRLADLFDAMTDGVMLLDAEWRIVFLNEAGDQMLGDLSGPLVGRVLWDVFPEMADTSIQRRLVQVAETGVSDRMEVFWPRGGRWGEAKMFPSAGQVMLYFRDITAEKEAAAEAATLIQRLTRLLAISQTVVREFATMDDLLDAIPRLVAEVLGAETALLFVIRGDELRLRSHHGSAVAPAGPEVLPRHDSLTGRAIDLDRVLSTADLQSDERAALRGHFEAHRAAMAAGIKVSSGSFGAVVVSDRRPEFFDEADEHTLGLVVETLVAAIERFESLEALQRSEERFRFLSEATTDAAYDFMFDADEIWFSSGYHRVFGWPAGDQPRDRWRGAIHPDDRASVLAEVDVALADPEVHVHELDYRLARAAGGHASVVDRMFVLRDRTGTPVRIVGGIVDVTEEVEAEQRNRRAQRLEAIGQLTGGVAHDFNNLLTVILGGVAHLHEMLDDDESVEWAEMIRAAAERGADLAHRLLAFARQQPLAARPIDIDALVDQVAALLRRTLPDDVELRVEHGAELWPALVDPSHLENAVINLCLNARDAMPDGGTLTVRTGNVAVPATPAADGDDDELAGGDYVMIEVADTGTGIDPDVLDRIFEPFYTTKPVGQGTGLGLSMVHGFAHQSSGQVTIESERGAGTTARLLLPRTHDEPVAVRDASAPPVSTSAPSRGARILVVEDDQAVQAIVARFLTARGYEVHRASSGAEALEVAERVGRFDLLFTDLAMPGGMNGWDLAVKLRERQPDLAVLYTSGYPEGVLARRSDDDTRDIDLLPKPYRMDELDDRIRTAIRRAAS